MDRSIDIVMVGAFLVGVVDLFTGILGGIGVLGLGFAIMYAIVFYGVSTLRRVIGK